jgi:hypothetical protein
MRVRGAAPLPAVRYASQGERKPDTRRFVSAYLVDASMLARFPQFYRQLKGVESALAALPRRSRQETNEPHWRCKRTSIRRARAGMDILSLVQGQGGNACRGWQQVD